MMAGISGNLLLAPVAFFEFFPASAGAGIVSSGGRLASDGLGFSGFLFRFRNFSMDEFHLLFCLNWADRFRHRIGQGQFVEGTDGLIADAVHQVGKQCEGLFTVFVEWLFLGIPHQTNSFPQMVHGKQVIFPEVVIDLQKHLTFQVHQHPVQNLLPFF